MKIKIDFNIDDPSDQEKFNKCIKAEDYLICLEDIKVMLQESIDNNIENEDRIIVLRYIWNKFKYILTENEINL